MGVPHRGDAGTSRDGDHLAVTGTGGGEVDVMIIAVAVLMFLVALWFAVQGESGSDRRRSAARRAAAARQAEQARVASAAQSGLDEVTWLGSSPHQRRH
jgi:hypothetical protein